LPSGRELPVLFNFTEQELKIQPSLNSQLVPAHLQGASESATETPAAPAPEADKQDEAMAQPSGSS